MAEALFNIEPGSLNLESTKEILKERIKDRVVASMPPYAITAIDTAQIAVGAAKAISASVAGGPLAIAGAVVAAASAINAALNNFASAFEGEIKSNWSKKVERLGADLVTQAKGRMLTWYRPAGGELTLKRAQARTASKKKDGITSLSGLENQFNPGYVLGVKRPGRSDYIVATVPVLVFRGGGQFNYIPRSIYEPDAKPIGPLTEEEGWEPDNKWYALGMAKSTAEQIGFSKWIQLAEKLINANASPPVRWQQIVCPGLAPYWGPYADELPTGPSMVAYHAWLMRQPPPDLDFVASMIAATPQIQDPAATGILDLLWAREDMARRAEGKKMGLKPRDAQWAGPFWASVGGEPPSGDQVLGGLFHQALPPWKGLKKSGGSSSSGAGTIVVVLAAGAAGYVLLRKRRS